MRIAIMMAVLSLPLTGCTGPIPIQMNAARKAAIHACNGKAEKYLTRNRLLNQNIVYGDCMFAHHQQR